MSNPPLKHLYLIDGSGYIFRAFHALPPLSRPDGTPVGAVLGFTNMLIKLLKDVQPDHIAVVFDSARENFRNEIYPEYKANRVETPPELIPQFPLIREACEAFNVPQVEMRGFEADDLIATYAKIASGAGADVTIVSSDKDLMQLVNDQVRLLDPMKNKPIGEPEVLEKFGVTPDKVRDVQALAGDSSDNIPGVPGIGIKTAAELINTYGDLKGLYQNIQNIKQPKRRETLETNEDKAFISMQLVTLKEDVPVEKSIDEFALPELDTTKVTEFLKTQNFKNLLSRFGGQVAEVKKTVSQDRKYELVLELSQLEKWIERIKAQGYVAVDTETTSLNALQANLVGVSLSVTPHEACYIPLGHNLPPRDLLNQNQVPEQLPRDKVLNLLKPILENPGILKIGQNIKYDMLVLSRYGIEITPIDDTMLISYVLDGAQHGHGMDELSTLHLDVTPIPYKEVAGTGTKQISFADVALDKACEYAAEDADITLQLHEILKPRLLEEKLVTIYETLDRPLVPVLFEMEKTGVKVDVDSLKSLSHDFGKRLEVLEKEIQESAGLTFNVASPKQLGEVLFENLGLPGGQKGKTGAYSTSADILEELSNQGHAIADLILEWRQLSKLKSTYTDALINQINPTTGRVHTSFSQTIANTGRLSSSDPNLQNIPIRTEEGKKIRRAFIANQGYKILSADYSQIELRLLADMANIEALKDAFRHGDDIHRTTASQVFGISQDQVDPLMRRKAKAINFGIIYGISPFGLAKQLGIAQSEAAHYMKLYFELYPGIKDYMEAKKQEGREKGFVTTLFGRRIYVPGINDRDYNKRGFAERQAINAPLQGTNADIMKKAMILIPPLLKSKNLDSRMILQVHDELVFEVLERDVEATSTLIKKIMASVCHLSIPLVVDVGIGDNWEEAH